MKYFFLIVAIFVSFSIVTQKSQAQSISYLPFGGRIYSTSLPGVTCTPNPQVVVIGISSVIPYYIANPVNTKTPIVDGWILGMYNSIPNTTYCRSGSYPYPARVVHPTLFGVSK